MIRRIRCGSGLGDSIYLRPVVDEFARRGDTVVALSDYPDVFLGARAVVEPFRRHQVDHVAHYIGGKGNLNTTQWQDVCNAVGITAELRFAWEVRNPRLVEDVLARAAGRPLVLVHGGRAPMARTDGFGMEMLPQREAFDATLAALAGCFLVRVGNAKHLYPLAVDLDLNSATTVADLLDLAWTCTGMVAQCSFAVPLAEAFDKPLLAIWAAQGLVAREAFVRSVTPSKVLSKRTSSYAMDDWPADVIAALARSRFDLQAVAA